MTLRGYDAWKTTPPDEGYGERCIRDDSTECNCSRCQADEDRFWDEQGEGGSLEERLYDEGHGPRRERPRGPAMTRAARERK